MGKAFMTLVFFLMNDSAIFTRTLCIAAWTREDKYTVEDQAEPITESKGLGFPINRINMVWLIHLQLSKKDQCTFFLFLYYILTSSVDHPLIKLAIIDT